MGCPQKFCQVNTGATRTTLRAFSERRVAASLSHHNLVRVYAAGESDGNHYDAMESRERRNLSQRLQRDVKISIGEAVRYHWK